MPLDTRIALSGQPLQLESPLAQYGKLMSVVNAGTQNQLAQMQMSAAQREQESVNALNQAYANAYDSATGKIDTNKLRASVAQAGFGSKLPGIEKTLVELDKERSLLQKTQGEVAAQPTALAKQQSELLDAKLKQSRAFLDTLDPADPNAPARYLQWHEANHADPIIGPALKARGVTADQSRAQIDAAVAKGPQAFAELINGSKLGTEKFMELNKPTTTTVDQSGQKQIFQTPGLGGTPRSVGVFADVPLPANVVAQKKDIAKSGASNINLTQNAEKSYGTAFGGKIADLDAAKLDAAGKAPDLAANANSVLSILNKGDVFVGPAATVKLNVARVLNAAGASNDEKIANTETLISNLGRNTLGMVKSSGLGTGQGFTDKDLQFLEKVAGGSIDYNEKTLRSLAELAHKAAAASAETWNKRVKEIPASATSGMGISLEPVVVPARVTKAAAARPAGVPAEWTLQVDGAGKRAYVSPDGKSFKEVP